MCLTKDATILLVRNDLFYPNHSDDEYQDLQYHHHHHQQQQQQYVLPELYWYYLRTEMMNSHRSDTASVASNGVSVDNDEDAFEPACDLSGAGVDDDHEKPVDLSMSKEDRQKKEMEGFVSKIKRQRLSMGLTQGDVGVAVGRLCDSDFSQTTISRFEAMNLSHRNMCKLRPLLQRWLEESTGSSASTSSGRSSASASPVLVGVRRRKKRTSFDMGIRTALERAFGANPKPTAEEISSVADDLGIDREVVRVWFCNRRQKEKKATCAERTA